MRGRADDAGQNDPGPMPSKLVDGVLALLEEAGVPTATNDQIAKLIEDWEHGREPDAATEAEIQAALDYGKTAEQHIPH